MIAEAALRPDRMDEILAQVTLPYAFYAALLNLQPGRHRYTFELLAAVWRFSTVVVMQFKHAFGIRRPADRSPLIQPVLLTPGHGAYPAGHATPVRRRRDRAAKALRRVTGPTRCATMQLLALAKRIGQNRVVAGLHYEHDIDKGAELGEKLAAYFVAQAVPPDPPPAAADFTALQWLWTAALAEHG